MRNYLAQEYDYTKLPPRGSINRAEADSLFRLFDEGTDFVLDADGHTWTYKGTLRYGKLIRRNQLQDEQHRISHVLHHTIDDTNRTRRGTPHGIFAGPKEDVFERLHQGFLSGTPDPSDPLARIATIPGVGSANNIPGSDQISQNGHTPTDTLRIVTRGLDVLTGYPKH
jgi:hypothetical protein